MGAEGWLLLDLDRTWRPGRLVDLAADKGRLPQAGLPLLLVVGLLTGKLPAFAGLLEDAQPHGDHDGARPDEDPRRDQAVIDD